MTIKRYEGATREEAIAKAKQEMGDEVVIMNVKEKRQSGVLGMFRRSNIEVTAAIEDDSSITTFLENVQGTDISQGENINSPAEDERENLFRERESLLRGDGFGGGFSGNDSGRGARRQNMAQPQQSQSVLQPQPRVQPQPQPSRQERPRQLEGRRFDASANEEIPIRETSAQGVFKDTSEADLKDAFTEISEVLSAANTSIPQPSTYDRNASLVKYNDPISARDYSMGETRRLPEGVRESFRSTAPPPNKSALESLSKTRIMPDLSERRNNRQVSVIKKDTSTLPRVEPTENRTSSRQVESTPMRASEGSGSMGAIGGHSTTSGVLRMLYNTLLDNEVDEHYVNEILNDIDNISSYDENLDALISNVYQKMVLKVGRPRTITIHDNHPMVAFFIGPTGVGKTTTIAKLASQFKLDKKKNVALLSADTYRIAASQQLSEYADRLTLPLDIIFPGEDINEKIAQFKKYDLIFVDTAGFSHNNESQRKDMKRMLDNVAKNQLKEIYLVLSATTKYRDLKNIVDTYKDIAAFNIVFTKLDETASFGNLLNIRMYADSPLSYVTNGQNVPKDIEVLDAQKLVRHLLEVQ